MINKKVLSALLSVFIAAGCCSDLASINRPLASAASSAASAAITGKCGDKVSFQLDDEGVLTISGNGPMSDYTEGESPFAGNDKIKKVILENGVTHIGNHSFSSCHSLLSAALPDSLTSIGEFVFDNCSSLNELTIPDSVTSIGQFAFSGTALRSVVIPDSVVTLDTNSLFMNCCELESVVLPQNVTALYSYAFSECPKLKEVDIPDSVTAIQNDAFAGTSFSSLFIPSSVTMINGNALRDSNVRTIYGFRDSAAESFAKKNGLDFVESKVRIWKRSDSLPVAGVYKLDCDVTVNNYVTINSMLDLDLNGHTVKVPEMICNGNTVIRDSDPLKNGTVICTADSNLITSYNKLTIYGGSFFGYDKKTVCATVRINDGSFDLFGGEITGYYSHALSVRTKDGIINLMGGELKTSSADNGKSNVYSVWLADTFAGTLNITGGALHSDLGAAVSGSPADCVINISGGKISSDSDHGLKCPQNGTVNLSGDLSINGKKGGVFVPKGKSVNITGAITSADLSVFAETSGVLTNGLGKYVSSSTLAHYLPDINANGTLSADDAGELMIAVPTAATTTTTTTNTTTTTAASSVVSTTSAPSSTTSAATSSSVVSTTTTTAAATSASTLSASSSTTATATSTLSASTISTAPSSAVTTAAADITTYSPGDVNGDGKIDANDATRVLVNYSIMSTGGECELDAQQQKAADLNIDGKIDASDATLILQYYSYLSTGGSSKIGEFLKQKDNA